ncbi:MAG: RNA polymerase sigma factor RpoD/SigA [Fimbriimonadaceae bacterium]|nr:RNA polymerase sigma factor RpoD/SigA [Fimbriimonadaceae bacterium]
MEQESGLPSYFSRLTQAPLLTPEEEVTLTKAVRSGDREARQRLIECNMRLVINVAKSYRNRSVPLEDLIQEGAIGLMQAAERFDPDKGYRFSTYATHWIRQAIGRAIDNKSKAIRVPAHVSQCIRRVERERARLVSELGSEPTAEQLAQATGLSTKKLAALMQTSQEVLSLDMAVGDSGNTTLGGLIRDESHEDPEEAMLTAEVMDELRRIMNQLNDREQKVMRSRFHLDTTSDDPERDIAKEMSLSRERVRQIELQAIKKLRALAARRRIRDILG